MTLFATILSSNIMGSMQSTKKMYFEVQNLFAGHVFLIFIRKCLGLISKKIFYAYLFASSLCKKCISKLLLKPFSSSQKLILWNQLTEIAPPPFSCLVYIVFKFKLNRFYCDLVMIYFHTETYQSTNNEYWFQWVDTYIQHKENNNNKYVTSYTYSM